MKKPKVMSMLIMLGALTYTDLSAQSLAASHSSTFFDQQTIAFNVYGDRIHESAKGTGTPLGTNLIPAAKIEATEGMMNSRSNIAVLKHERVWLKSNQSGSHYTLSGNKLTSGRTLRSASANPASGLAAGTGTQTGANLTSSDPEYFKKAVSPRAGTHSHIQGSNKWNQ